MTESRWRRLAASPFVRTVAALALLAYLPALTASPGRMPSDSKLYLYLNPGRFFGDAAATFDPRQFAGWVPHQHVAYLWPTTPWFWFFETLGVPDWIAHRLWIGTILVVAGLGVRWCARLLGLGPLAAATAAVVYQTSLYVLPYISRTSVMLLPFAGLAWIVGFTIRAGRRGGWSDPAAIALVVLTVGAVNATALAMIVPAPALWLIHAVWQRTMTWSRAVGVALRTGALSIGVSLWWIVMLVIQGRSGTDVLPYSESLADVSLTATSTETWRGLGYWLFYVRDPYAATTTESLRYLSSSPAILVSYLVPLTALVGLTFVRWPHRRFVALLVGVGLVLAVGVHPIGDRSPLMRLLAGDDDGGLALALRSSTRALPLVALGLGLAAAMLVDAAGSRRPVFGRAVSAQHATAIVVGAIAILNLPSLWTGAFVDRALERDQDPPAAWLEAAERLDQRGGRVLQLPGAEFGAYRWGYTVDQPLPALTDAPVITRDLLPLGSAAAMDLLYAFDDRIQDGVLEPEAIAPIADLFAARTIWLTNDIAFDRFATARPEVVRDLVVGAPGLGDPIAFGEPSLNRPDVQMTDERSLADDRVGVPAPPVELVPVSGPTDVVRARSRQMVVSGSGDGLVDAAAAGLLNANAVAVRYSADLDEPGALLAESVALVVTDSNRDRARHWRSSQDTTGFTEPGGPEQAVLRPVAADSRLELFDNNASTTQTVALQRGPVTATATSYGEPFSYQPEHRPFMAIDGDPSTAWIVGEHGDPIGETLRLTYDEPIEQLTLQQPFVRDETAVRRITGVTVTGTDDDGTSTVTIVEPGDWADGRTTVAAPFAHTTGEIDITITTVSGGTPFTGSFVAGVGFAEITHGLETTIEVVRPPRDALDQVAASTPLALALTRLRVDPMDRWRDDPEPRLVREFTLAQERSFAFDITARIDRRADDAVLADLFGWPVVASSRLTGSPRNAGVAAFDTDATTSWITAFGEALGATLRVDSGDAPIDVVSVQQPLVGSSTITHLTLRAGTESRTVELIPDATGRSTAEVQPPLPPGPLTVEIAAIVPSTTIDRRFGDPVELPAAIADIDFPGAPRVDPIDASAVTLPCTDIMTIDGRSIEATVEITAGGWLDGEPVDVEPCGRTIELGAGDHLIAGSPSAAVTVDRVVLDDRARDAVGDVGASATATAQVVDDSRFERTISIDGCTEGCWLILGEGYNSAWSADGPDGSLGEPDLIDGGFNGWWIAPSDDVADGSLVVDVRWTEQRPLNLALIVSALVALVAIAFVVMGRRNSSPAASSDPPLPRLRDPSEAALTTRHGALTGLALSVTAGLLIGPLWALWGALAGVGIVIVRQRRLAELTALASLLVVTVVVIARERRQNPFPNGAWPTTFESLHGLGMFAVAAVLVGALFADDAETIAGADDDRSPD